MWQHIGDGDEVRRRRYSWFCFSALIARLEKIARRDQTMVPKAAIIWTIIASGYPLLRTVFLENTVWKADEKERFDLSMTDNELIQLAINHHIPPTFAAHEIVETFAKDLNVFYWPSKTRMGFIP